MTSTRHQVLNQKTLVHSKNHLYYRPPGQSSIRGITLGEPEEFPGSHSAGVRTILVGNYSGTEILSYPILNLNVLDPEYFQTFTTHGTVEPLPNNWEMAYEELVYRGVQSISDSLFEKVVLGATCQIQSGLHPKYVFANLLARHEDAYCFWLELEGWGTWLGASPERLFISSGSEVELMALAATREHGTDADWGEKEKAEQAIVVRGMVEVLEECGYRDIRISDQTNRRSGRMEHICTYIKGSCVELNSWVNLMQKMHPSAALMGFPREPAGNFIESNENFDRALFTGFFGEVRESEMELAVIIRCAHYQDGVYTLFAGAGINKDSIPELEVRELRSKFSIMHEAIRGLRS